MGTYRAVRVDKKSIVLVHEPESTESHTIEIRNPGASYTPPVEEGARYSVSFSFSKVSGAAYVAPVVPLANTVENERQIAAQAASESTEATESPAIEPDSTEAVSPDGDSTEA